MPRRWLNADGKRLISDSGKRLLCDKCPCVSCPAYLILTLSNFNLTACQCGNSTFTNEKRNYNSVNVDGVYFIPFDNGYGSGNCRYIQTFSSTSPAYSKVQILDDTCVPTGEVRDFTNLKIELDRQSDGSVYVVEIYFSPADGLAGSIIAESNGLYQPGETFTFFGNCDSSFAHLSESGQIKIDVPT